MDGYMVNKNTKEEFRELDKVKCFENVGRIIWDKIVSGEALKNPRKLLSYILLTYAVSKKNQIMFLFDR